MRDDDRRWPAGTRLKPQRCNLHISAAGAPMFQAAPLAHAMA
jgi:hypothetical protein